MTTLKKEKESAAPNPTPHVASVLQVKPEGADLWALGKKEKDFGGWLFKKGMGTPRGMSYAQQAIAGGKTVESAITTNTFSYGTAPLSLTSSNDLLWPDRQSLSGPKRLPKTAPFSRLFLSFFCGVKGYDEGPSNDQVLQERKKVAKGGARGRSGTRAGPPRADAGWGNRHRKRKAQVRDLNRQRLFAPSILEPQPFWLLTLAPLLGQDEWQATLLVDNEIGWGVYGYKGYTPKPLTMSAALPKDKLAKNQTTG